MSIFCRPQAVFWGRVAAKAFYPAAMATRLMSGVADSSAFRYAVAHRRGSAFYDLSAMPQRRLLSLASFRDDGFCVHARGVPSMALPHVRPKVLFLAGRAELFLFRPLPTMRKFRSRAYFARPRGGWDDDVGQALPALPCLPLRSLPGAVLQHPASPKNPSLHGTRSREQRPRDGGWRKLILYRRSTCLLFGAARLPAANFR